MWTPNKSKFGRSWLLYAIQYIEDKLNLIHENIRMFREILCNVWELKCSRVILGISIMPETVVNFLLNIVIWEINVIHVYCVHEIIQ